MGSEVAKRYITHAESGPQLQTQTQRPDTAAAICRPQQQGTVLLLVGPAGDGQANMAYLTK